MMLNPEKVQAFLDVHGAWNPSLAFVMGGAVLLGLLGFTAAQSRGRPWLAETFATPVSRRIDTRLVLGSALFGAGWGLAGYCPGPALMSLVTLRAGPLGVCCHDARRRMVCETVSCALPAHLVAVSRRRNAARTTLKPPELNGSASVVSALA